MKSKILAFIIAFVAMNTIFIACSDDDKTEPEVSVRHALTLDLPLNVQAGTLTDAKAVFTNVNTKATYTLSNFKKAGTQFADTLTLPAGNYTVEVHGNVTYQLNGETVKSPVRAVKENVRINQAPESSAIGSTNVALSTYNAQDGFVISEIFFTGTLTPEGKQYTDDQYIKIGNNSDTVMYADGLAIAESDFLTVDKQDYTPDLMQQAMTVSALYVIPGSGKEHPVKPGEELVLAIDAKNHKEFNKNSIDLSKADFEFYDKSSDPNISDDDNPNVPNLLSWTTSSATYFSMHNRGFKAYAIARPQVDRETYTSKYVYNYKWTFTFDGETYPMDNDANFLPNTWIIDAVNLSVASDYQWGVVAATLDAGWSHCGSTDQDQSRYGKAVVRKKSGNKWTDTNNSTNDFNADAKPTLFK